MSLWSGFRHLLRRWGQGSLAAGPNVVKFVRVSVVLLARALVFPASVDPGAPLGLEAVCTLDESDNRTGTTIVGSITDPGGAVVVTIGDSDWQQSTGDPTAGLDLSRTSTITAPTVPGSYTFTVTCTTAGGAVYSGTVAFEVIAPPPPPTSSTTTTTSSPPTTTTSSSTTSTTSHVHVHVDVHDGSTGSETVTGLSSSANPSTLGQPVTFTATVTPTVGGAGFAPVGLRSADATTTGCPKADR